MKRARGSRIVLALAVAVALGCACERPAVAEDRGAAAQLLFDEALDLMKKNQHAAACPKLEESQRLDPGLGTQYRLAECYEAVGRLASAWSLFVEVAESARRAGTLDRAADAERRAAAVAPRLRRLRVVVAPDAAAVPGLAITHNGEPIHAALFGQPLPVDDELQKIEVSAPDRAAFSATVRLNEGATVAITIPTLSPAPGGAGSDGRTQRLVAFTLGVAGVAGLAAGAVFGVLAKTTWQDALQHCAGGAHDQCGSSGISEGARANTYANVGNVGFAAGGALLATGVVVYLLAPKARAIETGTSLSVSAGASAAGLRLRGTF